MSFFYVLRWLCILDPHENLDSWVNNFRQEFWPLKKLSLLFRDILFYYHIVFRSLEVLKALGLSKKGNYKLGTPAGEVARCDMYDRIR